MENLTTLPIGTMIQGTLYRIEEVLGQGSFGITYKVKNTTLNRVYALKEFFPQGIAERNSSLSLLLRTYSNSREQFETLKKKFFSEAKALADCDHPGIVQIHDIFTPDDNTIYYLMEYIEGVNLNKKYEGHPLALQDAIAMILKIAEPLKYIHNKKIAHFDLTPNNIMLRKDGSVVLIDFGFAKRYDSSGQQMSSLILAGGTPGYLAPEQMGGVIKEFTPSADIYALGGIFYFLLTGENPPSFIKMMEDKEEFLSNLSEEVHPFFEKAMSMRIKDRFATIDEFCQELSSFDSESNYVRFCENGKWNYENKEGKLLTEQWFDKAFNFKEGFGTVKLNDKWNYIDEKGNYISEQWFDNALDFSDRYGAVKLNDKWNYIDKEGKYISDKWFNCATSFDDGLGVVVRSRDKWNYITNDGKYLSDQWFEIAWGFRNGFGLVKHNQKWNYIDKHGKYLSEQWFESAHFFYNFGTVRLNGKWNYIDKDGKYLSEQWFEEIKDFDEGFGRVKLNDKWNYIDKYGKYLSELWFDQAERFFLGPAKVIINGKSNFIDKNGQLLSEHWLDKVWDFDDGYAMVQINGKWNYIDKYGNFKYKEWKDPFD